MSPNKNTGKTLLDMPANFNFDRSEAVTKLIEDLQNNYFVSVIGENGSGKSTLVKTTLVQKLMSGEIEGRAGKTWRVATTMPFADPLGNMAEDLCNPDDLFKKGTKDADYKKAVETQLRTSSTSLTDLYNDAVQVNNEAFNLLVIVDQIQELYRYQPFWQTIKEEYSPGQGTTDEKEEAEALEIEWQANKTMVTDDAQFINLLLNARRSTAPVYVIIITDSRYFQFFAKYRGLPEVMNNFQFQVPTLSQKTIRDALEVYLPNKEDKTDVQTAFVERLLIDFKASSGRDPFVLQKLKLCLSLVQNKMQQLAKKNPSSIIDPLPIYQNIGSLKSVIHYFITKEIFTDAYYNPDQKKQVELLFKALTGKGGNNQPMRRPVTLEELQALTKKHGMPLNYLEIRYLLEPFTYADRNFLRITKPGYWSPKTIVDLETDVLFTNANWPELIKWIEEENSHANVYQNLVRDALLYYQRKETPINIAAKNDESNPHKDLVIEHTFASNFRNFLLDIKGYFRPNEVKIKPTVSPLISSGASLFSANAWLKNCEPSEVWAKRYLPVYPSKSPNEILPDEIKGKTNLGIAIEFLKLSDREGRKELDLEKENVIRAKKQQTIATVLGVGALIISVIAGILWYRADQAERNIRLIDFVKVLDANDVLTFEDSSKLKTTNGLIDSIVKNNHINTQDRVLDLMNAEGIIHFSREDTWSRDALFNIYKITMEDKDPKGNHEASIAEIKAICADIKNSTSTPTLQHPYVYLALQAHVNELKTQIDQLDNKDLVWAQVEDQALVANPKDRNQYAYGSKNGNIFLQSGNEVPRRLRPNVGDIIRCLAYSSNGQWLLAGTKFGKIHRYNALPGVLPSDTLKNIIYGDPVNSIVFAGDWGSSERLLVATTQHIYFIEPDPSKSSLGKDTFKLFSSAKQEIRLKRLGNVDWSADHRWFIATGRDSTVIYQLNPEAVDASKKIVRFGSLAHHDITMTNFAIKVDTSNLANYSLALGDELGRVWLGKIGAASFNKLNRGVIQLDSPAFKRCSKKKIHHSSITSLKFNPRLNQLASSSFDGVVRLWNLDKFTSDDNSDDIVLRGNGQSINTIVYVNSDLLVAHAGVHNCEIRTNIDALEIYLDKLQQQLLDKQGKPKN